MAAPQKDGFDLALDFFFGALFVDFWLGLGYVRSMRYHYFTNWNPESRWICLLAATLIAGSLAALYRNQFWSRYDTYSMIPPMEERVSKRARVILWVLFAIGCGSLGLLFVL